MSKIYNTLRPTPNSNLIVEELNAKVYTKTFPGKGIFDADLYKSVSTSPALVMHRTCKPVNSTFVKTVKINIA